MFFQDRCSWWRWLVLHPALTPLAPLTCQGRGEGYMPLSGIVSRNLARVGCKRNIVRHTPGGEPVGQHTAPVIHLKELTQ
jgi:hypothetical protein